MSALVEKGNATPLYHQLADIIKQKIEQGVFLPGGLLPSENSLAREYGVSRMTARTTLKLLEEEGVLICDSTRGRVIQNPAAEDRLPSRVSSSSCAIAVYPLRISNYGDYYFSKILDGITNSAVKYQAKLVFLSENVLQYEQGSFNDYLLKEKIDCVFRINSPDFDPEVIRELEKNGVPTVVFNRNQPGSGFDFVSCDHYQGASLLMDSLCHMGHKRIACISLDINDYHFAERRCQAYTDALGRYGISQDNNRIIQVSDPQFSDEFKNDIEMKIRNLLKDRRCKPSALFIASGVILEPVLDAITKFGLNVPDDISLVCYDRMLIRGFPQITCVEQPIKRMAETAVDVLVRKLSSKYERAYEIVMEPDFIPGNSCKFCDN